MSYQLRYDEGLAASLRRVFHKQITRAIAAAKGESNSDDSPVHQVRTHIKKARAVLRLLRDEIGDGLFREHDRQLRDTARLISEIRDAEVRLQTVRELQMVMPRRGRAFYRRAELLLIGDLQNFMAAFAEWQKQAVPMMEQALTFPELWPLQHYDDNALRRGVQSSYRRARRALRRAKDNPTPENFHRLRSRAKLLWLQLRLLRSVNPVVLRTLTQDLRALNDLLGRGHDLSFLAERLSLDLKARDRTQLLAPIEVSEDDLHRGAADLADRFFSERSRDFGKRVGNWLEDWSIAQTKSVAEALIA